MPFDRESAGKAGKTPKKPRDPATTCGAETNDGTPCLKGRGEMTDHPGFGHCKFHAGTSPSGKKFAEREAARSALAALGTPYGTGDPFELLRDAVRAAHGQLRAALLLVRDAVDATSNGQTSIVALEAATQLLDRVIRTAGLTGKETVDADVADREVAIAQYQAEQMVALFTRALDKAAIPIDLRAAANQALIDELREVKAVPVLTGDGRN